MSLAGGATDIMNGIGGMIDARSAADFEAMQLQTNMIYVGVQADKSATELRRSFEEQRNKNLAAMAVSGVSFASFDPIEEGNVADMNEGIKTLHQNKSMQQMQLSMQADEAKRAGKMNATAALFGGFIKAADTLATAESNYQKTHMIDQTRKSFFLQSTPTIKKWFG